MLSKVLSRTDRARASTLLFPSVGAVPPPPAPDQSSASDAKWRERVEDLERRIQTGKKEAFAAGLSEGEQRSRTEWQPVIDRLNRSVAEVLTARSEMRRRAERDAVQLALMIARRVLHRELSMDENALAGVAQVAFDRITRSESYRVTVHPRFAAAVIAVLPASQRGRVQIEPDPNCAPGTLIIHSADGTIDASVETQMEEITRGLTDRLAHSS